MTKRTTKPRNVALEIIRATIAAAAIRILGLSVKDVAEAMGMSRQGVYNAVERSEGHATKQ